MMDTTPRILGMSQQDIDHVLSSACLYAYGRGTYAEDGMLDVMDRNRRLLSPDTLARLAGGLEGRPTRMPDRWRRVLTPTDHDPSRRLVANPTDRRIMWACAFRHDLDSDDPAIPGLWERYEHDYHDELHRANWDWVSARDLIWNDLVPLAEPIGDIQTIDGRINPPDDRWVPFFRLMRDGGKKEA